MTALYLLEPDSPGTAWAPFADSGPLSTLRAGGWTIAERWARALRAKPAGVVAPVLSGADSGGTIPVVDPAGLSGPAWVVEATFCPKVPMRPVGGTRRLIADGRAVAWRLESGEGWRGRHDTGDGLVVEGLQLAGAWDLVTALEEFLFADALIGLEGGTDAIPDGVIVLGNPDAVALRGASVEPGVVLDVRKGAVVLERGVSVRSGSRLEGPCWIREDSVVSGGQLRHVSAGPHCRLHGEIATTVFAGHANKSHDGFLGHSVVGAWVNLGAGTITSNLKNTYGPIRLDIGTTRLDTGRHNLGSLIGDHVKTAIGTLLPTGAVLGTGANLFGAPRAPKYVAPFSWGDDGEELDVERFIAMARRVLPRRGVAVDAPREASLRAIHARARAGS
jgi:UDP-N-acetylglucosamine diphosphorylase/glucosamine-1-phosphate N-acetyltransferase